jgi:hypothetical protein
MQDRDTQERSWSVRLNAAQLIPPHQAQRDAGSADSAGELYLVIELVRPDTNHLRDSTVPAHVDGAGGSPTD